MDNMNRYGPDTPALFWAWPFAQADALKKIQN
jgi:hypothetical protein